MRTTSSIEVRDDKSSDSTKTVQFVTRESILTQLKQLRGIRSIYCLLIVLLTIYDVHRLSLYGWDESLRKRHTASLRYAFANFSWALIGWIILLVICIAIIYPIGKLASKKKKSKKMIALMSIVVIAMSVVSPVIIVTCKTLLFSSVLLFVEQLRLSMKTISFFTEVGRKKIRVTRDIEMHGDNNNKHVHVRESYGDASPVIPTFGSFVRFLFSPTLIYRIDYPKTRDRSILQILLLTFESFSILLVTFVLVKESSIPLSTVGQQVMSLKQLSTSLFACLVAGFAVHISIFYVLMHCWQNIWAEIGKFGDRQFYTQFWEEEDVTDFYSGMNLLVTQWIQQYPMAFLRRKLQLNPGFAYVIILLTVLLFHDLIALLFLGFFAPMFFVFLIAYVPYRLTNYIFGKLIDKMPYLRFLVVYGILTMMWSLLIFSYTIEFYARENCPPKDDSIWATIGPRSLSCMTLTVFPQGSTIRKIVSYFVKVV